MVINHKAVSIQSIDFTNYMNFIIWSDKKNTHFVSQNFIRIDNILNIEPPRKETTTGSQLKAGG